MAEKGLFAEICRKLLEHQINQSEQKSSQKSMFSTLITLLKSKLRIGLSDGIYSESLKKNRTQVKLKKP
jgi:uncharacterized metal-binding protein